MCRYFGTERPITARLEVQTAMHLFRDLPFEEDCACDEQENEGLSELCIRNIWNSSSVHDEVAFARLAATQAGARRVLAKAYVRNLRLERIKKAPHLTKQRFFQNSAF